MKKQIKNKIWKCIWSGKDMSPFPQVLIVSAVTNNFKKAIGQKFSVAVLKFKNGVTDFYFPNDEWMNISKLILDKIIHDKIFVTKVNQHIKKYCDKLVSYAKKSSIINLKKLNNNELFNIYNEFCEIDNKLRDFAWVATISDFNSNNLTDYLYSVLQKKVKQKNIIGSLFVILTKPRKKSFAQKEKEGQKKIINVIRCDKIYRKLFEKDVDQIIKQLDCHNKLNQLIRHHYNRFCWISVVFEKDPLTLKDFVYMIKGNLNSRILEEKNQSINLDIPSIKLNRSEKRLFKDVTELLFYKAYRKDMQSQAYYYFKTILNEIASRLQITVKQARYLLPLEVKQYLIFKKHLNIKLIKDRFRLSLAVLKNGKAEIFTGKETKEILNIVINKVPKKEIFDSQHLVGKTGYPGKVIGIVKLANNKKEAENIKKGNILVSMQTNPDMINGIRNCSALVTDHGGITCHAAIISRELGIPCIIGTKIATKVLKDGDLVEVNANKGIVRLIKFEK